MAYDYDVLVIGMGPAGMAASAMTAEMGLRVCGIESHRIGGECMNVGCIPSKALLRIAKHRHSFEVLNRMGLAQLPEAPLLNPFAAIQSDLQYIGENKTLGMFKKVELVVQQGKASFLDPHTVQVGERTISAKRIFIATGTRPAIPPFPGIDTVDYLTNENVFNLEAVPRSLVVFGGGAIATELAQAFTRLGSQCTVMIRGEHLLRGVDPEAVQILEEHFAQEGITVMPRCQIKAVRRHEGGVEVLTEDGQAVVAEKLLVATGRRMDFSSLNLEKAGVRYSEKGITVNKYLQTSQKHIFAIGDCNGHALFSHAAMHQGMIAVANCVLPRPFKQDYRKFVVPWTIFTEPQISHVGATEEQLQAHATSYESIKVRYEDYGAAIAEKVDKGFVKVFTNPLGKLFAATVVGEGSADMINEWGLAIQRGVRMHDILFLQHSFPSMAFLNKRISEMWMMKRMQTSWVRSMARRMFHLF